MSIDPATLAISALVTSSAGTVLGAAGEMQAAKAQSQALQYQAAIARNNQIIAQRRAEDARQRGELESNLQRQRSRLLTSQQRAALAGAGVTVDQDSALQLTEDTAALGELDALTIRSNAEREALGFESEASNFGAEASLQTSAASNALSSGRLKAGATLLSGFGSVANKWYGFKKEKVL